MVKVGSRGALLIRSRDAASFDDRSRRSSQNIDNTAFNLEIQSTRIPLENLCSCQFNTWFSRIFNKWCLTKANRRHWGRKADRRYTYKHSRMDEDN